MSDKTVEFKIAYDGPALATHEMNVKDLAPALLSVGELIEEANAILNGDQAKIAVNIKATQPGSVLVSLSVIQDFLKQAVSLFSSNEANAIVNASQILGFLGLGCGGSAGVLGIIKWLKNREIKNITTLEDGNFRMEVSDGETRVVKSSEIKLFKFISIRKNLETIIKKPLEKEGVEKVSFILEDKQNTVTKDEKDYFSTPTIQEEILGETETEQSLQIVNISFQESGKWKFSDGNATFYADILDKEFAEKVQHNQAAFAKDDVLKVRLKRKQYLSLGGIKTDYIISKVIEHRSAAIQIQLPFDK
jgi:hypothetical protein